MNVGDRVITPTGEVGYIERIDERGEARFGQVKRYRYATVRNPDDSRKTWDLERLTYVGRSEP